MITAQTICALAISLWTAEAPSWYEPRIPAMQETCEEVASRAEQRGHDPTLLISLAWEESRFRWVESSAGAVGPLQVLPSYFCPGGRERGCDLIDAGISAFEEWQDEWPRVEDTLCHYNGGNRCGPSSYQYASRIIERWQDLAFRLYGGDGC